MSSNLKVVAEVEVPDPKGLAESAQPKPAVPTAPQSAKSSEASQHLVEVLEEIRLVLNARAGALIAMLGALMLTAAAMWAGTWMALGISISFDILVFIPIALIAYARPRNT